MTGNYSIIRLFFLWCMLSSAALQADTVWQEQSSYGLENLLKSNPDHLHELNEPAIKQFYNDRNYLLLWSDENGRLRRAFDLLHVIIDADDEGLKPSDFYIEEIRKHWALKGQIAAIRLDLLLTAALYSYSNYVYSGRFNPANLDVDWHIKNKPLNIRDLLTAVATKKSIASLLDELPPQHSGYQLLKKELHRLRVLEDQGAWPWLDGGPILKPGVQHGQVTQLRRRLEITGDLIESSLSELDIYDFGLAEAVKRFQKRHGLVADGKVGEKTRQRLNMTVGAKIMQIRINMERWRWMPRSLGKRYLMVNMTGFELNLMEDDVSLLNMPVIIGKSYRSTPSFSGLLSEMEYNPYWTIPKTIAVEDMVPRQMGDSSYFARKTIKLFRGWGANAREIDPNTVDWKQIDIDHFPYWLRQEPGAKNSLGMVKFLFTNPYDIYLHGTPDIHLFNQVVRAFSSGCIRVKDPVRLASYLLYDGSQEKEEEILANIYLKTTQRVLLPKAIPIYLVYWTTWVDQQGILNFRNDIYSRDVGLKTLFTEHL